MCGFGLKPKDQFLNPNRGAARREVKSAAFDSRAAAKLRFKRSD